MQTCNRFRWQSVAQATTMTTMLALMTIVMPTSLAAHGMHSMHVAAGSSPATTNYKCPVCRMDTMGTGSTAYNNQNYVLLTNGQRIYTCGMEPRELDGIQSTDTAHLAANMAAFIVKKEDDNCDPSCPECAQEGDVLDPIDGTIVTSTNYKYICLKAKQKIYFSSETTRNQYLDQVGILPRVHVDSQICQSQPCNDATTIETLNAQAKAFDPTPLKVSETTTAISEATTVPSSVTNTPISAQLGAAADTTHSFCSGGSVMFNGFQSTVHGTCVMLFFQSWILNTVLKYILGFLGCMLMAIGNEYLVKFREQTRKALLTQRKERATDTRHKWFCKLVLAVLYMIQMTVAYFAMLVVMSYETGLFVALILGFGVGFILFKDFDKDVTDERGVWRYTDPSTVRLYVEGMTCMKNCGTTVENALRETEGVTKAFVDFETKTAYAAGSASVSVLIEAVDSVGFTAQVAQATTMDHSSNV